ncbi:MAG: hypothetical protein K0Q81_1875, partial [Paenibacillus sp.]|nr:hypothetical protein [Paenibacillus sp.]
RNKARSAEHSDFELFGGNNKQAHILYLGHRELFNVESEVSIALQLAGSGLTVNHMELLAASVEWQYWSEENNWTNLTIEKINMQQDSGTLTLKKMERQKVDETEINAIRSRWIRGIASTSSIRLLQDVHFHTLKVVVMNDKKPPAPDLVFYNDIQQDAESTFYPFGKAPRLFDTMFVASQEAFSKKGATVELRFTLEHDNPNKLTDQTITAELTWEYWNGKGWRKLTGVSDNLSIMKTSAGTIKTDRTLAFTNPVDSSEIMIQGQLNYWIRVRIVGGGYGGENMVLSDKEYKLTPNYIVPKISGLQVHYTQPVSGSPTNLQHIVTSNNLDFMDQTSVVGAGRTIRPFYTLMDNHQALYLGFDRPPLKGPISLYFSVREQEYTEDNRPRMEWEYYRLFDGQGSWAKLDVLDDTRHLTQNGCVEFIGPMDFMEHGLFGKRQYWIRALDSEDKYVPAGDHEFPPAPKLKGIYPNTAMVTHSESIPEEMLGSSQGTAFMVFSLSRHPVLSEQIYVNEIHALSEGERKALIQSGDKVVIEGKDGAGQTTDFWVRWSPVDKLNDSQASDRHYEIDQTFGTIRFGDGIHGMVPPIGTDNVKAVYRTGGGAIGNVGPSEINMLRTSIAFVDRVANPEGAEGGFDTELLEQALERGPYWIKHRNRAVTAEDYEQLALQAAKGIARVKCLPDLNDRGQRETGWVTVMIVPQTSDHQPNPTPQLRRQVQSYLEARAANVAVFPKQLKVIGPVYVEIAISTVLVARSFDMVPTAQQEAIRKLKAFLHPLTGGSDGRGWEFGTLPCLSDFYSLLEADVNVDHVDKLSMTIRDPLSGTVEVTQDLPITITPHPYLLIFSGEHNTTVKASSTISY